MDQSDITNVYTYGCRAYLIRKEVLKDEEKVARKTKPRTHICYLVGYNGSNIYRIWVPQNGEIITVRDVEFQEDEIFDSKEELSTGLTKWRYTRLGVCRTVRQTPFLSLSCSFCYRTYSVVTRRFVHVQLCRGS
jgi:hypothetical protein